MDVHYTQQNTVTVMPAFFMCLPDLSDSKRIYLKSLAVMVNLSIVSNSFVSFHFICFEASFLGTKNLNYFIILAM